MPLVENLKKFKSEDGDCPTLVCTDLASRGLDLDVDHVVMFDFPTNSIDYLHRTGRIARMGAKGKVTMLVAKDYSLATRIEEAIQKNESLESLSVVDYAKSRTNIPRVNAKVKSSTARGLNQKSSTASVKPSRSRGKVVVVQASRPKTHESKAGKRSAPTKARKSTVPFSKPSQSSSTSAPKRTSPGGKKPTDKRKSGVTKPASKLNVVGFKGRSASRKEPLRPN